jgi:predicted Fe-Mo cluster-binding NifX family protein
MKVAVSAQRGEMEALVDPRFGRAVWFVVKDMATEEWIPLDNSENAEHGGGGGLAATQLAGRGVGAVITGNVGVAALRLLDAAGVRVFRADNGVTVRDALEAMARGDLPTVTSPTISGPWSRPTAIPDDCGHLQGGRK